MIVKIIGGAPFAISIVLTVFMGGLGVGSFLASRTIDRVKEPMKLVRIYGLLEMVICVYALTIPALLVVYRPIYAVLYNRLFGHFILYNLLTFIGCSILLCIPVICMGATLPILCRFYVTKLSHLGTHAGRLYGLNTVGAALGALLCGFWLINLLGMSGTLILAVAVNGVVGMACLLVSYSVKGTPAIPVVSDSVKRLPADETERTTRSEYPGAANAALVIFAVSGFCAMAYEVIWTKLLGLIVGPTTYSFTIVLVTFISGLALGSMIFGWLGDRIGKPVWLLILTQIAAALFALGASQMMGNSQFFFAKLISTFREHFALLSLSKAIILFGFMTLPTFCLGATFPLVGKIYTQSVSGVGRSIGVAYTINTIGAVSGSFCAGFLLIPFFGKEKSLSLVVGLQLLTALVVTVMILCRNKENILKLVCLGAPALAGLFLCFRFPMWNRYVLSVGKYHRFEEVGVDAKTHGWLEALLQGPEILARVEAGKLVYYGDGIGGFTTVLEETDSLGNVEYAMANSGKMDASSRGDMPTQTLLAHFGMLFHRNPRTVMVLGLASGVTAGEVLHYPVEQLDVLEISQQVVEASDFFVPWNNNVVSSPRANLIIQDGRAHLQLTRQKYDVIISEPSNPWMAGLATLFTHELFTLAKNRLNDDGIFVQWLHSYEMDWPTLALVGRTFAQVFPNNLLVLTEPSGVGDDYLLVGFKSKNKLTLENAEQNLPYLQQSKNVVLADAKLLYRLIVSEDLQRLFGQGPVNTDKRPRLEFAAPKLMYHSDATIDENIRDKKWLSPGTRNIIQRVKTSVDAQIGFAAYALSLYVPFTGMVDLSEATPSQRERFFGLVEAYCADNPLELSILGDDDLREKCRSIQIEAIKDKIDVVPDKALSYFHLAGLYYGRNMHNEAIASYLKSLQIKPYDAEAHYNLGLALTDQSRHDEAITHFTEALRIKPDFVDPHSYLAYAYARRGELDHAVEHYAQWLEINPDSAEAHSNLGEVFVRQGKLDEAITHFTEALLIKPSFPEAHNNLGYALAQQGRLDEAVKHYTEALWLKPEFADAHHNLGVALARQGQFGEAISHFTEALRIRPDFASARKNLEKALLLRKSRDKKKLKRESPVAQPVK
jgi:spermidine synthase